MDSFLLDLEDEVSTEPGQLQIRGEEGAAAEATEQIVSFKIMVDQPYAELQRTLQRLVDFVAVGLAAVGTLQAQGRPSLPVFPMVRLGPPMSVEEFPREYQRWLVDRAIEGCIEALEPLLKRVWGLCRFSERNRDRRYRPAEVEGVIRELEGQEFERVPLGQQLIRFKQEYPGLFEDELLDLVTALKKLRVCLTHAAGTVREDTDETEEGKLVIPLSRVRVERHDETGAQLATPGMVTERESWLVLRSSRESREFRVGERVEVTLDEFVGLAYTVWLSALRLRRLTTEFLKQRGLLPADFQLPEPMEQIQVHCMVPSSPESAEES